MMWSPVEGGRVFEICGSLEWVVIRSSEGRVLGLTNRGRMDGSTGVSGRWVILSVEEEEAVVGVVSWESYVVGEVMERSTSLGSGRNRLSAEGSEEGLRDLPYDFGVRMYD